MMPFLVAQNKTTRLALQSDFDGTTFSAGNGTNLAPYSFVKQEDIESPASITMNKPFFAFFFVDATQSIDSTYRTLQFDS